MFTNQSVAGRYELVVGKGVKVCEAYEQNLNTFAPKVPMVCGRPANAKLGFSKPEWKQPTILPNGASLGGLFFDFSEFLWERDVNPVRYLPTDKWPQWKGTPEQYKEAREQYEVDRENLWVAHPPFIAELDIDNDGQPDHVYFERPCGSVYGDLLGVLTKDYKKIDRTRTELVIPHPPFNKMGFGVFQPATKSDGTRLSEWKQTNYLMPTQDGWSWVHYDLFIFEHKTYLDQWWRDHPSFHGKTDIEAGALRVFTVVPSGTIETCRYAFTLE